MDSGDGALASRVLEAIKEPVFATDDHGVVVAANIAAVRMIRRSRHDVVGTNLASVLRTPELAHRPDLDDRDVFDELMASARRTPGTAELDLVATTAHVSEVTAHVAAMPSGEGDRGWVFTIRPRSDDAGPGSILQRARLFDLSLDLIGSVDSDGLFVDANPAWSILGYDEDALFSHDYLEVVHEADRERVADEVAALQSVKPFTLDFTCRMLERSGGVRWYQWTAVHDPFSDTVSGVGHDVSHSVHGTQRHHQQIRQLRDREAELTSALQSARRSARFKDDLINQVSHEVRTPLTSVIGFTGLLAENVDDNLSEQNLAYLERIHRNGIYVLGLIENVLDRSRSDAAATVEPEPVDLATVVREAILQSEGAAAAKGLAVVANVPEGLAPVAAAQQPLIQVLINLIGNAVKYTERGSVLVRVCEAPATTPARIDVVDRGTGIPVGEDEAIFTAYHRIPGSASAGEAPPVGSGLGLSIARTMCREMGFDLVVDSIEGEGSTFSVLLTATAPHPVHPLDCSVD